jgi:hypothetical protein
VAEGAQGHVEGVLVLGLHVLAHDRLAAGTQVGRRRHGATLPALMR